MRRNSYDDYPLNDQNETTAIIKIEKKQRRNDSIGWIIGSLLLIFFTIIAVGRITLIGQFIDDVIFTFPFGWFKYIVYLLCLILGITIFIGVKIKLKRRVRHMILVFAILACWMVSNVLLIVQFAHHEIKYFDQDNFVNIMSNYINHWQKASIFNPHPRNPITFVGFNGDWITLYAGGGIIGNFIAAIFSYLTIFGSLALALCFTMLWFSWVFTGSPIGMFRSKKCQNNHGIRVVKLTSNKNCKANKKVLQTSIYQSINIPDDEIFSSRQVMHTTESSDITIQMPSFTAAHDQRLIEDLIADDYQQTRNNKNKKQNYVNFNEPPNRPQPPLKPVYIPSEHEYIQPRYRRQDNNKLNDAPFYSSAYGNNVDLSKAREKLNSESAITPFGKLSNNSTMKTSELRQTSIYDENDQTQEFNILPVNTPVKNEPEFYDDLPELTPEPKQTPESYVSQTDQILEAHNKAINRQLNCHSPNYHESPPPISQPRNVEINKNAAVNPKKLTINESYELPKLSLLNEKVVNYQNNEINKQAAQNKALKINEVFQQFNVAASVQGINIGPTITKFEIHMQPGVKVNKITSLENDLKYALATQNVRIEAPIQGKSAVGIEIANQISNKVTLREIMEKTPLEKQNNKLLVAIGRSVNGEIIFIELDKMPHLLVAGSTGSGKSVSINTVLSSLLLRTKPHEVKLLLIDPKQVELAVFNNLPHLLAPVIYDTKLANGALKKVIGEMERRYSILSEKGVRNIETYNAKVKAEDKLPYIVVVIDELADLMMTAGKDIEDSIMRITQLARAAGIHMIIATQRPSTDVITGVIKTNIPSRIAFAVASSIDSRTILDQTGAEKLIGYGDMLYAPAGQNIPTRAQGAYISDEEIERLVQYCRSQQDPEYEEEFLNIDQPGSKEPGGQNNLDPLYHEIKRFVILNQKASTSLIQRKFSIGYNRASRLIDLLEDNGVIGPQNGAKPREVYIQNLDLDDNEW
ncbi:hypothetical protein P344_01560 [Spiroplasma mirum ATCC 29335]|uniref:FtsK domain-containing protein n=1 Tax=Spiroplasma mirum ATCC 29335 TaxID=838561 RepID=W0GKL3_9MOLU|nr:MULTISPECIES: DNA translocase FtsK [Spiroplasma]AHF60707.1 putative DNA segregation ATP binding translocase transmembrane protein [Spiroplasma mirum ATCC 29335]AHI57677.1 hypothetical protein P344_01560 [Spiroplasma mirum ATCC 29335]AKM52824.1 DNA translocase [Spiroplasma atrichopogonis]